MPIYVFKCKDEKCDQRQQKLQSFEAPPPPCTKCNGETEREMSKSSFVLKGPGWFNTGGY